MVDTMLSSACLYDGTRVFRDTTGHGVFRIDVCMKTSPNLDHLMQTSTYCTNIQGLLTQGVKVSRVSSVSIFTNWICGDFVEDTRGGGNFLWRKLKCFTTWWCSSTLEGLYTSFCCCLGIRKDPELWTICKLSALCPPNCCKHVHVKQQDCQNLSVSRDPSNCW